MRLCVLPLPPSPPPPLDDSTFRGPPTEEDDGAIGNRVLLSSHHLGLLLLVVVVVTNLRILPIKPTSALQRASSSLSIVQSPHTYSQDPYRHHRRPRLASAPLRSAYDEPPPLLPTASEGILSKCVDHVDLAAIKGLKWQELEQPYPYRVLLWRQSPSSHAIAHGQPRSSGASNKRSTKQGSFHRQWRQR